MNGNKVEWFLIFLVIGCAVVWLIGAFISWNLLWFISGWFGRLMAVIFGIIIISGAVKAADET